jgi:hypothetical protein
MEVEVQLLSRRMFSFSGFKYLQRFLDLLAFLTAGDYQRILRLHKATFQSTFIHIFLHNLNK